VPQAFVGLYWRSVLLISRSALSILSAAELQAIVAHEIGHEYFWETYLSARNRRDTATLQEIELKCDVIAVLTLDALGLDGGALGPAWRKLVRFNGRLAALANAHEYPTLAEREAFLRRLLAIRAIHERRPPHDGASGHATWRPGREEARGLHGPSRTARLNRASWASMTSWTATGRE
jgi:hypothetical protein